ncbi:MAG: nitrous oxide reductase family maturation protein NosD [Acidobacteria bacterium]|nr:MAG: nitrous oxide reductase family maturation protein NosD [Acidobacteriota bacterium]
MRVNFTLLAFAICTPTLITLTLPQFAAAQDTTGHTEAPPSRLERRGPAIDASPLQARIDAAQPGDRIDVAAGTYTGDLYIDRPLTLVGHGRPKLVGSGHRSVVMIRADHVTFDGFDIDGQLGGSLSDDTAGIHVSGHAAVIVRCRIERSLFGVYLYAADDTVIDATTITGILGKDPGEQGSGIHSWNTKRFRLTGNTIRYSRDGFYLQSSSDGFVLNNRVSDVRYGLHYMFSDRNAFEDNVFERGAAGAALMYSKDLTFRRNSFLHSRGFGSVGLLLRACDNVLAEDNLIADNARGLFLEGSTLNVFRGNLIAESDAALVIYDSSLKNRFEGNAFIGNLTPLRLSGRRTDTVFDRNYWSDDTGLDLDGDGVRDDPYRLSNVFDHLRGNLSAADLVSRGLGARALSAAERGFPVLRPIPVLDAHPLARPPVLSRVPAPPRAERGGAGVGFLAASAIGAFGMATLTLGRRLGRRNAEAA